MTTKTESLENMYKRKKDSDKLQQYWNNGWKKVPSNRQSTNSTQPHVLI